MEERIYLIGMNHKTAGVEIRETFALDSFCSKDTWAIPSIKGIQESLIISTCNRVEIIAFGNEKTPDTVLTAWAKVTQQPLNKLIPHTYILRGREAIQHLFRVTSSLDSMVLGEPQILGQIKDAYRAATRSGASKTVLNRLLHKAFSVAKRVRTETKIASNAVSISYAAVELAKKIFGNISEYNALLIGAGDMAELAALHLFQAKIKSIKVANRTYDKALEIATKFNGEAIAFDALIEHLKDVDIIISSTGSQNIIIHKHDIQAILPKRKHNPMFFIDIAVPRDIDPDIHEIDNIYLYNIDDLKEVIEENLNQRREEAIKAHNIMSDEVEAFCAWLHSLSLQPTIVDLRKRFSDYAEEELLKTLKKIGPVDKKTQEALETMVDALIRKLTHDPISYLKCAHRAVDSSQITFARQMFNLDALHEKKQVVNED